MCTQRFDRQVLFVCAFWISNICWQFVQMFLRWWWCWKWDNGNDVVVSASTAVAANTISADTNVMKKLRNCTKRKEAAYTCQLYATPSPSQRECNQIDEITAHFYKMSLSVLFSAFWALYTIVGAVSLPLYALLSITLSLSTSLPLSCTHVSSI